MKTFVRILLLIIVNSQLSIVNSYAQQISLPAKIQGRTEQVIKHTGYTVSYNEDWKIPNWVAYVLTAQEVTGEEVRSNNFEPDPDVWGDQASTFDYKNSGYDRGHMAPAADMKWNRKAMRESFYLSNVCPQNHNLNGGDWRVLEEKVRDWATEYGSVYVICGPVVAERHTTIGEGVVVPSGFFKVVVRKSKGKYVAIGFYYNNKAGHKSMENYVQTASDIEIISQIDLLPSIPDAVKERVDLNEW